MNVSNVANVAPEFRGDFATADLYLRWVDADSARTVFRAWVDRAFHAVGDLGHGPVRQPWLLSEQPIVGSVRQRSERADPHAVAELLDEDTGSLTAYAFSDDGGGVHDVRLELSRFGDAHQHLLLHCKISCYRSTPALGQQLTELMTAVAGGCAFSYGQISVNHAQRQPGTRLDILLRRSAEESADASLVWLRGYEWITLCPGALADTLGGAPGLRDSGGFADVVALPSGVLLRSTESPSDYDETRARQVWQALRPVLPQGQPRPLPLIDFAPMVLADAA